MFKVSLFENKEKQDSQDNLKKDILMLNSPSEEKVNGNQMSGGEVSCFSNNDANHEVLPTE